MQNIVKLCNSWRSKSFKTIKILLRTFSKTSFRNRQMLPNNTKSNNSRKHETDTFWHFNIIHPFQGVIMKFNIQLEWLHVFVFDSGTQTTDNALRLKGGRKVWWIASWKKSENYVQLFAKWNWICWKSVRGRKLSFVFHRPLDSNFQYHVELTQRKSIKIFLLASANDSEAEIKRKIPSRICLGCNQPKACVDKQRKLFFCIIFLHSQMNSVAIKKRARASPEGNHSIVLI